MGSSRIVEGAEGPPSIAASSSYGAAPSSTISGLDGLQQQQHERYQRQMQRLGQEGREEVEGVVVAMRQEAMRSSSSVPSSGGNVCRCSSEQQHREIDQMNAAAVQEGRQGPDGRAAPPRDSDPPPPQRQAPSASPPRTAPPLRPPDLPPPQQPRPAADADGRITTGLSLEQRASRAPPPFPPPIASRSKSLESGLPITDGELPSLRDMAAPIVGAAIGVVGRAAAAMRRRASAAAAAAAAASGDGRGAAAAAAAASALLVGGSIDLEPLPMNAGDAAANAAAGGGGTSQPALPPDDLSRGVGGEVPVVSQRESAAAAVNAASDSLRGTCAPYVSDLSVQREALSSSAARSVSETLGIARERIGSMHDHIDAEVAMEADPLGGQKGARQEQLVASSVDACAALREARKARVKEVEQLVKTYEKRVDALRATRLDEVPSGGASGGGDGNVQAELQAVEKGLKEVESAAAFELEQALWRGGLRGEALQERLNTELDALRNEWLDHKAKVEENAIEASRKRASQRVGLAAYVQASILSAAAHMLSRLLDVAVSAGGELTSIALRALHQRANATIRDQRTHGKQGGGGAHPPVNLGSGGACVIEASETSSTYGDESSAPPQLALNHVLELMGSAEALSAQLHSELTAVVRAVRDAHKQMTELAQEDQDLRVVASRAGEEAQAATAASERALEARRAAVAPELRELRVRAANAFTGGVELVLDLGEALAIGAFLRVTPGQSGREAGVVVSAARGPGPPPPPSNPPPPPPPPGGLASRPPLMRPPTQPPPQGAARSRAAARPCVSACAAASPSATVRPPTTEPNSMCRRPRPLRRPRLPPTPTRTTPLPRCRPHRRHRPHHRIKRRGPPPPLLARRS